MEEADYIIVGAGAAGCILANRLSADGTTRVLLLEAGPRPRGMAHHLWTRMPAGIAKLFAPGPLNWGLATEPEPGLGGRRIGTPLGRGLGGSTLVNGMAFFRGHPADYARWAALGLRGWEWADLLPAFMRIERAGAGEASERGRSGELPVTLPRYRHPASADFICAASGAGADAREDVNAGGTRGAGWMQFTIAGGERHSAARAFLAPHRANLRVLADVRVDRIVLDGGRAVGVQANRAGEAVTVRARAGVVVAAGAIGSPALLARSGIGAAAELARLGIPVVRDTPGVGANLQDHLNVPLTFAVTPDTSINARLRGWRVLLEGLRYLTTRAGPLTMGVSQACAFVQSAHADGRPDIQVGFRPMSWSVTTEGAVAVGPRPEITVTACFLRPDSRGSVRLRSPDPAAPPMIVANYLESARDREAAIDAVHAIRRILASAPLAARIEAERDPGPACTTDEAILAHARARGQSMHHWVGTCRMGTDALAVTDERLRVHGVGGLHVADGAAIPFLPSANPMGCVMVLAERAAEMIRADARALA